MDQMRMTKQVFDLQKATFDGMLSSMLMFWDQTERMLNSFMDQAVWVPDEGKKAFAQWIRTNKKGCEDLRSAVADGFKKMEGCFVGSQRPGAPEA
jgi:hypothetical protein